MKQEERPIVNLIPREWVIRRRQTVCLRRWIAAVAIVTVVIGVPCVYIGGSAALTDSGMADQINEASIAQANHEQAIPLLRERLRLLLAEQQVLELVENRIEWREVFSILVEAAGSDIRFRRLSAVGGGIEDEAPVQISVEGLAPTQTIARQYIVDLESQRVFDHVQLIETRRETISETELIRFRLLITVESVGAGSAGAPASSGVPNAG